MRDDPPDLKAQILGRFRGAPEAVWTPVDFLDLASRGAVDKALQRLATGSEIRRLGRGLYDQPRRNPLTSRLSVPDYRRVIQAVARRNQARMLVDGMTAANDLGLSDAVPSRVIVHTDARLRPIKLGKQTIAFRLAAPSKLFWADRPAMRIVQSLHWLREALTDPHDRRRIQRRLRAILVGNPHGLAITADLSTGLPALPAWMQDLLRPLIDEAAIRRPQAGADRGAGARGCRSPRPPSGSNAAIGAGSGPRRIAATRQSQGRGLEGRGTTRS